MEEIRVIKGLYKYSDPRRLSVPALELYTVVHVYNHYLKDLLLTAWSIKAKKKQGSRIFVKDILIILPRCTACL